MRQWLRLSGWAVTSLLVAAGPAGAAELVLKRVMLSSGGVGYFEYEAAVDGNATLTLDVALDQVDDVLKSLVVYDQSGSAGEVTLPGREPLSQGFADLPFDRAALGSLVGLLNALQGAEIRVGGAKPIAGRLVHVDEETAARAPGAPPRTRYRVSLLTDAGLQQFLLQDAESIAFADPDLQGKIATALERLAAYRAEQRRRLTLTARGAGPRTVRVGYVVAAPLWKASYRLSLPAEPQAATARLQGWAVLENFSGRDWRDVELTLLSGNPVTFRQALYESYYVPRPTAPVESGSRILPSADTGTLGLAEAKPAPRAMMQAPTARGMASIAPPPAPAAAPAPPPPPAQIETADAAESETQIAFTLPFKLTAAVGQSLLVPLLDRALPARRVDLYQQATERKHPLAAIELVNDGATGLPPGVLTLYQEGERGAAYLGDARLAAFPSGDKRMLSYAVDAKVAIDASTSEQRPATKAAVASGVVRVTRQIRHMTAYRIKAAAVPSRLVIEHPRHAGWNLSQPDPQGVELSAGAYRIPADFAGTNETTVTVTEDQPVEETIALAELADDRLDALVSSRELDPKLRRAMADLAARRRAIATQRGEVERLKERREQLVEDETRLRDNLAAVGREAGLRKRLLDKFTETETAIEAASASLAKAADGLAAAERDLAAAIAGLTL